MLDSLSVAARIAERLCAKATWSGSACRWEAWLREGSDATGCPRYRIGTPPPVLYQGGVGTSLFLAELFRATQEPGLVRVAAGGFRDTVNRLDRRGVGGGFHCGIAGFAYALCRFQYCTGSSEFGWALEAAGRELEGLAGSETCADFLSGAAGAVVGCLQVWRATKAQTWLDIATLFGERLLKMARYSPWGFSWGGDASRARDLVGLAHGTAGIAYALLDLFGSTGDGRFGLAAWKANEYEDAFFDPRFCNWLDFRHASLYQMLASRAKDRSAGDSTQLQPYVPRAMCAWCHGAAGIGLARVASLAWRTPSSLESIQRASTCVRSVLGALGLASDLTYCHGRVGLIEALWDTWILTGDAAAHTAAIQHAEAAAFASRYGAVPFPGPSPDGWAPDSSLMLGEAGIGYLFLRLARPETPSVLLPAITPPGPLESALWNGEPYDLSPEIADDYLRHFLGRTKGILLQAGSDFSVGLQTVEIDKAIDLLRERISTLPATSLRRHAIETLSLEEAVVRSLTVAPLFCDQVIQELDRLPVHLIEWESAELGLAAGVTLHVSSDHSLLSDYGENPRSKPSWRTVYALRPHANGISLTRLDRLAGVILTGIGAGSTLDCLFENLQATRIAQSREWKAAVRAQLVELYKGCFIVLAHAADGGGGLSRPV